MSRMTIQSKADAVHARSWSVSHHVEIDDPDRTRNAGRGIRDDIVTILGAALEMKNTNGTRPSAHIGCKDGSTTVARLVIALDGQGSGDPRLADSYIEIVEGIHVHVAPDGTATLLRMNRTGEGGAEVTDENLFVKPDGVGGWEIGRWVVTTQAERKDIARHLSRHIKKTVMGSEHGRFCRVDWDKVVNCAGAEAGCRISFQEDLCRSAYGKGCDILVSGFMRNALGEEAFLKDLEDRCSGVVENQIRHLATLAAIDEASDRARAAFARHGISIRVRIEENKDLSSPIPMVTHYGSLVSAYVLNHDAGKGLQGHDRTLALIEDLIARMESNPGQMKDKFQHLSPESVKSGSTSANTYLMNILRHLSDDPVTALRRIIAHKERKWTAEDFSDLFGRPVDLELSVRFNSGRLLCEGYLGNGVSIKNTAIVMRSLNLPETTLIALKQKATSMKMKDVVDHPCLPDSLIERMDLNPSSSGDTIVLWPVASSQENVVLGTTEERKAA